MVFVTKEDESSYLMLLFFQGMLNLAKPDKAIFILTCRRLGIDLTKQ